MLDLPLTSRQRVLAALRHEEADRVPVDLGGMRSTGITAGAYLRLKAHLGLDAGPVDIFDTMQQLAVVEGAVRERFAVDVVPLDLDQLGPFSPYPLPDGSPARVPARFVWGEEADGCRYALDGEGRRAWQMPAGGLYFSRVYHPLAQTTSVAEVEALALPTYSDEDLSRLRAEAERLQTRSDYAVIGRFGGSVLETCQELRGFEQLMGDLADGGPLLEALLERVTTHHLQELERYLAAVGRQLQIIQFGDDLGMQSGPMISPQMYRRLLKPSHVRLFSLVHQRCPELYVFLHSCGGLRPLLGDLVEAGVQVLNPVQTSACGMDPVELKREWGADLVFWGGGCDTQTVLPRGRADEVREMARRRLAIFAPGGGYVFAAIHNIQADVPPGNTVALFDAARGAGGVLGG